MSKLVRLYPRHPQLGFVLRSYTILEPQPLRFLEHRGWYEVDDEVADLLADVPQQERYPTGPKAFMIASDKSEAKAMEERARDAVLKARREETVGTVDEPVKTSTPRPGAKKRATVAVEDDGEDEAPTPKPRTRKKKSG